MDKGNPSYSAFADAVAFAGAKHHISIYSPPDSLYAVELHRLL